MRQMTRSRRRGFTQIELAALLGIASLVGVQIIPAINDAREAARRTQCKDNLHNMGLAIHNYCDVYAELLPNGWVQYTYGADEGLAHGWQTRLLPYLDQAELYNRIFEYNGNPSNPSNPNMPSDLFQTPIESLRCPSDDSADLNAARDGWATSNYVGNFGSMPPPRWILGSSEGFWPGEASTPVMTNGAFMCNRCTRIADFIDGTSNTIVVGERSSFGNAAIWMGVRGNRFETDVVASCSQDAPINTSTLGFSSLHPDGSHFVMCDGAVRFFAQDISLDIYEALGTRNVGEQIERSAF